MINKWQMDLKNDSLLSLGPRPKLSSKTIKTSYTIPVDDNSVEMLDQYFTFWLFVAEGGFSRLLVVIFF